MYLNEMDNNDVKHLQNVMITADKKYKENQKNAAVLQQKYIQKELVNIRNENKKYIEKIKMLKQELQREQTMRLKAVQKVEVVENIFGRELEEAGVKFDKIDATKTTEIKKKLKAKEKSELSKALNKVQQLNEFKQKLTNELQSVKKQLNQTEIKNKDQTIQQSILETSNKELSKQNRQLIFELELVKKESNEELMKENKQIKELAAQNQQLSTDNIRLKQQVEQQEKRLKYLDARSQTLIEELKLLNLNEQESIALVEREHENEIGLLNEEINKLKDKGSVFQISNLEEVNIDEHVLTEARSASNVTFVDNLFLFLKYNKVTKENVNELDKYFNVNEYDSETITEDVLDEEQ
eukprot:297436_1